jgi:VWFA-related protein
MPRASQSGPALNILSHALCLILTAAFLGHTYGQQQPASAQQTPLPAETPDAVFRVTTDLVQADVIVVDQQGRFVDNLQREQLELHVDGRPLPISTFERVQTGPVREGAPLVAKRKGAAAPSSAAATAQSLDGGRTVLFFVDDFHLGHASLERARNVLTHFVDSEIGINDQAAIAATSGQIGFLQQLTSNRAVLRAAVASLRNRSPVSIDMELPSMTAHQAYVLEAGGDRALLALFIRETQRVNPFLLRDPAENVVLGRAHRIVEQSGALTLDTLIALETLVRSVAELPGRKVVFFISDGFEMNLHGSDTSNRLRQIADAAARSRVVIYTMDARGLATLPSFDASRPAIFDPGGVVDRTDADELGASQEPLYKLAADTGGRALINSNALAAAVPRALQETATYYLLGWTPEQEEQQSNRFHRIEVSVRGRPELTVRVPRGYYDVPPLAEPRNAPSSRRRRPAAIPAATPEESPADAALLSALRSAHPVTQLPASLWLGYVDVPNAGTVLTASTQLNATTLDFGPSDSEPRQAIVDVVSSVFDDRGQGVSTVKEHLTVSPSSTSPEQNAMGNRVTYSHRFQVKPGLYQVRVAARDSRTGRVGSAMEWIEIPDVSGGPFSMSSLILGANVSQTEAGGPASVPSIEINPNHHFRRAPRLRFLTYIYNAARSTAPPDVVLKVQVFRDDEPKPVIATPLSQLRTEEVEDLSRIPYLAEINMEGMPNGKYVLQVTAADRTAGTTASQRTTVEIE